MSAKDGFGNHQDQSRQNFVWWWRTGDKMWRRLFQYIVAITIGFLIVQVLLLYKKKKTFRRHKETETPYHPRSHDLSTQPHTPNLAPWSHAVEGMITVKSSVLSLQLQFQ